MNEEKMNAIIVSKYGGPEVLKLSEVEKPIPKENEVLVRNYATSINTVDIVSRNGKAPKQIFWGMRHVIGPLLRLAFTGLRRPKQKIPGFGFAGEIVSVGSEVKEWKVGDLVIGYHEATYAEFVTVPSHLLAKKPSNISFEEAAAVPGGSSPAILAFRDLAPPKPGDQVLVIGASGGIGTFGVQIAKIYGAEVTGVCGSTNVEILKEIGVDDIINYEVENYTKGFEKYDIIFDAIGVTSLSECKKILKSTGLFVSNNPFNSPRAVVNMMFNSRFKSGTSDECSENLEQVCEWIEAGKLRPVVKDVYPLAKADEAHMKYESGNSRGRVVIKIRDE